MWSSSNRINKDLPANGRQFLENLYLFEWLFFYSPDGRHDHDNSIYLALLVTLFVNTIFVPFSGKLKERRRRRSMDQPMEIICPTMTTFCIELIFGILSWRHSTNKRHLFEEKKWICPLLQYHKWIISGAAAWAGRSTTTESLLSSDRVFSRGHDAATTTIIDRPTKATILWVLLSIAMRQI